MKNSKVTKILLLVFALTLILCLGIAASASSESDGEIEIVSKNAYFGDQTYLYFAVDNTALESGEELEVLLYVEDPRVNPEADSFKAALSTLTYTPNPDFAVFKTFGIPPKAIGDTIYALPHVVGTELTYDALVEYSVLEYLYEMLYTTDLSDAKAELGEALVNYGEKAQKAFNYKTDALVTSLYYAYISVGTLDGANYSHLYTPTLSAAERTVTLPTVEGVSKWAVSKYDAHGNRTKTVAASGANVVIDANTVIEPSFIYDFEESDNVNTYIASGTGAPVRANGTRGYLTIAKDAEHGNVLVHNASNNVATAEVYFDLTKKLAGANTFAFEADMKLDATNAGNKLVHIQPYGSVGPAADIFFQFAEGEAIKIFNQYNNGNSTANESTVTTTANEGEWFNLRIEYTLTDYNYAPTNGVAKDAYIAVYVNGELATVAYTPYYSTDTAKHYTGAEDTLFAFFRNSGDTTNVTAYFDNVLVEQCKTETPAFADFENGITPPYVSPSEIVADADRGSDVWKLSTTASGTDKRVYAINDKTGANAVAFDAYVKFDVADTMQQNLEFILAGEKSIKVVFYGYDINHTSADYKGNLRVTNSANAGIPLVNNIAPENGWFHIRIEYINNGDSTATVNVIVDGTTVATSNAATVIDPTTVSFTQVNLIKASDSTTATVYLDDASVTYYVAD